MMPAISINYLAVLVCAIVAMPVGFLWFGPLFGKRGSAHGIGEMQPPDADRWQVDGIFFQQSADRLGAGHSIEAWQASSWGLSPDAAPWIYGLNAGLFNWLGFFSRCR